MDAQVVQRLADLGSDRHKVVAAFREDVHGGDELVLGELPHVQFVERQDAIDGQDGVFHFVEGHGRGDTLEEDEGGAFHERQRTGEDDNCDNQTDNGVAVILPLPVGLPDDKTGRDNTNVAQSISKNMENQSTHVHGTMGMTMASGSVSVAMTMLDVSVPVVVPMVVIDIWLRRVFCEQRRGLTRRADFRIFQGEARMAHNRGSGVDGGPVMEGEALAMRSGTRRSGSDFVRGLHEGGACCCGVTVEAIVVRARVGPRTATADRLLGACGVGVWVVVVGVLLWDARLLLVDGAFTG